MSPKLPRLTASELLRALQRDGWYRHRQRGSHVILKHPDKVGRVVLANHPGVAIKPGTMQGILDDAGITVKRLRELL